MSGTSLSMSSVCTVSPPMITFGEPSLILPPHSILSPTREAGRRLMNTVPLPWATRLPSCDGR
jgi:hypothetical protein